MSADVKPRRRWIFTKGPSEGSFGISCRLCPGRIASGGDQFEFRLDDIYVSPSTPTKVSTHTHYPQTGQSLNTPNAITMPTGFAIFLPAVPLRNRPRSVGRREST